MLLLARKYARIYACIYASGFQAKESGLRFPVAPLQWNGSSKAVIPKRGE
jgi:hypothetical protein